VAPFHLFVRLRHAKFASAIPGTPRSYSPFFFCFRQAQAVRSYVLPGFLFDDADLGERDQASLRPPSPFGIPLLPRASEDGSTSFPREKSLFDYSCSPPFAPSFARRLRCGLLFQDFCPSFSNGLSAFFKQSLSRHHVDSFSSGSFLGFFFP